MGIQRPQNRPKIQRFRFQHLNVLFFSCFKVEFCSVLFCSVQPCRVAEPSPSLVEAVSVAVGWRRVAFQPLIPPLMMEPECRVCRDGPGVAPLYHPCRCKGSLRWVHGE